MAFDQRFWSQNWHFMVLEDENNTNIKACIVIPMYNEEAGAEKCIKAINNYIEALEYLDALIIVNDGSTDATGSILKDLLPNYKKLIIYIIYYKYKILIEY